jgi:phytoene dehydrogenase-like protein
LRALGLSQRDVDGYFAYEEVFDVLRRRLRTGARNAWEGPSPSRAELEEMLDQDKWLIDILFDASIAEVLDHYLTDERLKNALYGQGVIGAYAGPYDWGTASVKLMHYQGDTEGQGPVWAYVEGGMGQVSFAADGERYPHFSMISVTPGMGAAQSAFEDCKRGVANVGYGEIYFQTGYDPSSAPPGKHLMSVFGQYAPYSLAVAGLDGGPTSSAQDRWDSQRDAIAKQFIELIGGYAPNITDCIEEYEVLGPPDIEARIGLTGGHIFQGETMPDQMWEHRLTPDIGIRGFWLCGAATHPAGSVIGLNGRNAAAAVLGRPVT